MYRVRQQHTSLRQAEPLRTGVGYTTELAGRDRVKFFRCPVEPQGAALLLQQQPHEQQQQQHEYDEDGVEAQHTSAFVLHFSSTCPPAAGATAGQLYRSTRSCSSNGAAGASSRPRPHASSRLWRGQHARTHHLPSLTRQPQQQGNSHNNNNSSSNAASAPGVAAPTACDAAQQTDYRESEAQTDPYTPDYYIPDGAPSEPEVLQLAGLRWHDGLPGGQEEVELLARLRRRRAVEAALPRGEDAATVAQRYAMLHALEEEEWREREEHVANVQQRRLDAMAASLQTREDAREALAQQRLAHMQAQRSSALRSKLERLAARRLADVRRGVDTHIRIAATAAAARATRPGVATTASTEMAKAMTMPTTSSGGGGSALPSSKTDLITSYVKYGSAAAPPVVHGGSVHTHEQLPHMDSGDDAAALSYRTSQAPPPAMYTRRHDYDVRPQLLGSVAGTTEVDEARAVHMTHVDDRAFTVPTDAAVRRLSTLHKRREAERLLQSLEYAQAKIDRSRQRAQQQRSRRRQQQRSVASGSSNSRDDDDVRDADSVVDALAALQAGEGNNNNTDKHGGTAAATTTPPVRVLDLYRATPRIERPATPVLELDGDAEEDKEEACLLLQRLLRGRAVQNTFYEGKERCRGLIAELQAASNAKYAERSLVDARERQEMVSRQEAMVQSVLDAAQGGLVADALGCLFQERTRQYEARRLAAQRAAAERARCAREADEQARRAREREARARAEVHHAACVRATDATVTCFLQDTFLAAVDEAALHTATAHEHARRVAVQQQKQQQQEEDGNDGDSLRARETAVCDVLDSFVVPTVVRTLEQAEALQHAQAPACAVLELAAHGFAQHSDGDE